MWTICAYDDQGNLFPGFLATTSQDIAQTMMDRLSLNPQVCVVMGTYRQIGWQGPAILGDGAQATVMLDGAGLKRQAE